ncbi:class I glutamine amidotransferase-like protein [Haematococcus lacustris]
MPALMSLRGSVAALLILVTALGGSDAARSKSGGSLLHLNRPAERGSVRELGPVKNSKPLIGILTQPCHTCPGKSYIAAGFVKWIEAAGGRAVPIRFYATESELYRIFKSINGLVFPGGLTWLWLDAPYVIAARKLFNWAVQANDAGDVFPIHGTCLGFQLLHILASNISRNVLLVDTDSVAHPTTLKFWGDAATSSHMFSGLSAPLRQALESPEQNIVLQNHMYGMPPAMYTQHPVLASWYNIVSTSEDRNGTEYISTMEGKKYPFTGTQWHPEKPPFEFGMEEVPHSLEAISVSQHLANVFIESARRSSHKPESKEEELALLVYDTCPVFSERFETTEEENYDGPDITYYLCVRHTH